MRNMMRWMAILSLIIGMGSTGCTESADLDKGDAGSWIDSDADLGDPDTTGAADTNSASDSTGDEDGPDNDLFDVESADIANPGIADVTTGADTDVPSPDTITSDVTFPVDTGSESSCNTNSDCVQGEVCCVEGMQGGQSCKAASACQIGGGTCNTADECAPGEGCCDLGAQFPKICSTFCADDDDDDDDDLPGGGIPGSGEACQPDGRCRAVNEVCCPGLLGNYCALSCGDGGGLPGDGGLPGGIESCTNDAECGAGDLCCTLVGQSICVPANLSLPCE